MNFPDLVIYMHRYSLRPFTQFPFVIYTLMQDVRKCRQIYMMAKALSRLNPLALLVIAIDGSDQSSYATPYFSQVTKDSCMGWRMRLKLIGALVSGRLLHFFTLGSNWESGEFWSQSIKHVLHLN